MSDDDTMRDVIPMSVPWKNWHETVKAPITEIQRIWYPPDNPPYGGNTINRCTRQIQRAMASAKSRNLPLKPLGRGWSLSDVNYADGVLLETSRLIGKKPLRADQISPAYPGNADDKKGLWLVQCGNYISEINEMIEGPQFKRSLRTSGAANGQTIIGATSTGTHGSALEFGALHDHIVAIHLLAGPTKQYWIERASRPVMKDSLPAALGAQLIRDDDVFNAVVVGVGAFGVIHNVVIETAPRIFLEARNFGEFGGQELTLDANMRTAISTLDFSAHPALQNPPGFGDPYFFQPIIDPNSNPHKVLITQMYKRPWPSAHVPDYRMAESKFGPGYDFLSVIGRLLDVFQAGVPLFAQIAAGALFEAGTKRGSWGEIFGFKPARTKVASGSVGVALPNALTALDTLIQLNQDIGPVPVVFGCRYVKKSPALLAENRFDTTFVISVDGVLNQTTKNFFKEIPNRLEAAGIPYTQHWGKSNGYTKARLQSIFGSDYDKWIAARHQLLPDAADRALFTNTYMSARGLDA